MDLVALTEELIKSVAVNQEAVSVKEFPSENPDKEIVIQVRLTNQIWDASSEKMVK